MSKGKLVAICVVWLVIFGVAAVAWKWIVVPAKDAIAESKREKTKEQTSDPSLYKHQVNFALDSFSGYAILRSKEFRDDLAKKEIKLILEDDAADYSKRFENLKSGKVQMAAFTIDALIKARASGSDPAVIVGIIDETRGADAMVAYKSTVPNIDAINHPDTRFILTPDSPSATLARVVMSRFNLDQISGEPFVSARDSEDVFNRYKNSSPNTRDVYVLWEPYVSKVLENSEMHVVVDSSRFTGYIVDVIVASRDFLTKKPEIVCDVLGSYFRAAYVHRDNMVQLVMNDAKKSPAPLTEEQATRLVKGIWWKNTKENFAHFHLQDYPGKSLQYMEDAIANITDVLVKSKVITSDPTNGQPSTLLFSKPLRQLMVSNFHPQINTESVRKDKIELSPLSETEWNQIVNAGGGTMDVPPLEFARSRPDLTESSKAVLDELAAKLETARYYVVIQGNASRRGDPEQNRLVAEKRAQSAANYLVSKGVSKNRIRAVGVLPNGRSTVSFVLGEPPY